MKKIIIILMASVLCTLAVHAKVKKNLTYLEDLKITDSTLVKENREVTFKMDIDISDLRLRTQHTVALIPVYVSKDSSRTQAFPSVIIDGKTRDKIYLRSQSLKSVDAPALHDENALVIMGCRRKDPKTYEYTATLPYESWMLDGQVILREKVHGCVNCEKGAGETTLLDNLLPEYIPAYNLDRLQPKVEIKIRMDSAAARINFKWDKYDILPNYKNNRAELDTVINSIARVKNHPDMTIKSIYIDGYASPEGTIAHNETLSKNRAYSLSEYVRKDLRMEKDIMHVSWHGEDWEGFKKMMLVDDRMPNLLKRDEVVRILETFKGDSDACQELIEAIQPREQVYLPLLNVLYPELRRNQYKIIYQITNFDLEKSREVIKRNPENLNLYEMYMVLNSYGKGTEDHDWAYKMIQKHFPQRAEVLNDKALELVETQDYEAIITLLEGSSTTKDSPVLLNTLGVAYAERARALKAVDSDKLDFAKKAEAAFEKAIAVGKEIDIKMKEIEEKKANGTYTEGEEDKLMAKSTMAEANLDHIKKVIDQL